MKVLVAVALALLAIFCGLVVGFMVSVAAYVGMILW